MGRPGDRIFIHASRRVRFRNAVPVGNPSDARLVRLAPSRRESGNLAAVLDAA